MAIAPNSGPSSGGVAVVVAGQSFQANATLSIGGVPASGAHVIDPTAIVADSPPLAPGSLNDVAVSNPSGIRRAKSVAVLANGWLSDFLDVPEGDIFHPAVETIFRSGVTAGCGGGSYCRDNPVRRDQMAVFLLKAEHGPAFVPDPCTGVFDDVPCSSPFAPWIERLSTEGLTLGCGGSNYCPDLGVTRTQMAIFVLKTLHGPGYVPPPCVGVFADVPCPFALAADWIEELYQEGVTGGCSSSPLNYCPAATVTRGQMGVFLSKAFAMH